MASTTRCARSSTRSFTSTSAPAWARVRAISSPTPCPAPVTSARWPARSISYVMVASPESGWSDRAAVVETGDLVGGEAAVGQRGVGVLAQRGRWTEVDRALSTGLVAQAHGSAQHPRVGVVV